jgi:pimeloyl-ACP methyl ester carboxylesterase
VLDTTVVLPANSFQQVLASPLLTGEKEKGSPVILFLHGMRFTSDIWMETKTLEVAWRAGYTAIAVDLPGYGKTKHLPYVDNNMRAEFVKAALEFARR